MWTALQRASAAGLSGGNQGAASVGSARTRRHRRCRRDRLTSRRSVLVPCRMRQQRVILEASLSTDEQQCPMDGFYKYLALTTSEAPCSPKPVRRPVTASVPRTKRLARYSRAAISTCAANVKSRCHACLPHYCRR